MIGKSIYTRVILGLSVALFLSGCSFGHPLVGIYPGEAGEKDDRSLLVLAVLGSGFFSSSGGSGSGRTVLRYAYVGGSAGLIRQYTVNDATGVFTANGVPSVASGANVWDLEVHPNNRFVYGADRSGTSIYQYAVNAATGVLSPLSPATVATSSSDPIAIAIHPGGRHGYAGFVSGPGIDMFSIDPDTGLWSAKTPANLAGCSSAKDMAFHPSGNFFYVVCDGGDHIRRHSVDSAGQLTFLGATGLGSQPNGLTLTPDGAYLYVADQNSSQTYLFAVNGTTGDLTALGTPAIITDTWPAKVVVDSAGLYAYVNCWNAGSQTVRMYRIGAGTGILSNNTPASISTGGSQPIDMRGDPTGRYVYALNSASGTVNMYSIASTTGLLTSNGLVAAAGSPRGVAFVTETVF